MPTAIIKKLILHTDNIAIEVYVSEEGNICFYEQDENSDVPFWFSISPKDWDSIIKFTEQQKSKISNPNE